MEEKWYLATLIVQCKVEGQEIGPWTTDEQVRVIRASNPEEAYEKALQLGEREKQSYENMYGETVYWEFVGLADLAELLVDVIEDGTEIKSCLMDTDNPSDLIREKHKLTVFWMERNRHRKAIDIMEKHDILD